MATAKIKGPLSLATADDAPDYNAQMSDLMTDLRGSPDQDRKDSLLAWSAGLGTGADGSGLGGALGRAAAAESGWRSESKKLKAQYIPLIMNAVAAQQANNIQQKLVGSIGQKPIADMTLEEVNALENQGGQKGLTEKWKLAKSGVEQKTGWNVMPDGRKVYVGDPSKGVGVDEIGNVVQMPGAATALAGITEAGERAKLGAQADFDMVPSVAPDGTPVMIAKRKALAAAGAPAAATGAPAAATPVAGPGGAQPTPLGMRNNNPGNLRPVGASTGFQQFDTPEAGLDAMDQNLAAYGKKGVNTLRGAISRWAPPSENNTDAYVTAAAQRLGIKPDQTIDLGNPVVRRLVGSAIALHENGPRLFDTQAAPTTAGLPTGRSPTQKAGDEALVDSNKSWQKNVYDDVMEKGSAAGAMLDNLNTARVALRDIGDGTGWSTPQKQKAAEILGALGVEGAAKKASAYQTFQQAAMTQVNSVLNLAKGPQTDQDARRAQETFISLGKTPQANQFMIDYAQAVADRQKRRADFYRQAAPLARDGGDMAAVDRSWSKVDKSIWDAPVMRRWNKK